MMEGNDGLELFGSVGVLETATTFKIKEFNVLNREERVCRNLLLEASAGTGKTFTIENLVLRLLTESEGEKEPIALQRMLIVTFTKAATRDLKLRIRSSLDKALSQIKRFLVQEEDLGSQDVDLQERDLREEGFVADYLQMHRDAGIEALKKARRRFESALLVFDQAEILTIHGFCWRMLQQFSIESGTSLASSCVEEKALPKLKSLQVVRDFMRTELNQDAYSPAQVQRVLQLFSGSIETLQEQLLQVVLQGQRIYSYPSYLELSTTMLKVLQDLQAEHGFVGEKIVADFLLQAPSYKGICMRNKQVRPEVMEAVIDFANMLEHAPQEGLENWDLSVDKLIKNGLVIVDALAPHQRSLRASAPKPQDLHYPGLYQLLQEKVLPIVERARDPGMIFARMANRCQQMVQEYQDQEEVLGFNDLLHRMKQAVCHIGFAESVRKAFDAVIVDEFQDTDPVQWDIFRTLFVEAKWQGHLYLVGDPKQSIYAFRQADIYTYLSAAQALGEDAQASLDTNFRSQPTLIHALNVLFESAEELFPLPRTQMHLPYRRVKAGKSEKKTFCDGGACLQFLTVCPEPGKKKGLSLAEAEAAYFFPCMIEEIKRLHVQDGVPLHRFAILVADRYQAKRTLDALQQAGIAGISQRGSSLADSTALPLMREMLDAILHYKQASSLYLALAGRLIGMSHTDLLKLQEDKQVLEHVLLQCERLRSCLSLNGFSYFYSRFMQSSWHGDGKSVQERLLEQEGGIEFYRQWQEIAEILMEEEAKKQLSPEALLACLDEFDELALNEDERLKESIDLESGGVMVLTSHVSKGLEFDVVFTLGAIKRSSHSALLIPVLQETQSGQQVCLVSLKEEDESYQRYMEELDAEKMRQLYVALTRAKYRLYVPVLMFPKAEITKGQASPMELFLARLKQEKKTQTFDYNALYASLVTYDVASLHDFVQQCEADIEVRVLSDRSDRQGNEGTCSLQEPVLQAPPQLTSLHLPIFQEACLMVQSFTSLGSRSHREGQERGAQAPHDAMAPTKNAHTLPAGKDTGVLLHAILEKLPFDAAKRVHGPQGLLPWIRPFLVNTPLESWQEVVASLIFEALRTPLPSPLSVNGISSVPPFCLADVDPGKILKEADFLFPCTPDFLSQEADVQPGYMKGTIDLFFEHEGKYYLADWKGNWLGDTIEDYNEKALVASMQEHGYGLQAKIYKEALQRYLKIFDPRPFEELFGGIYYLFLRGIGPNTGILQVAL